MLVFISATANAPPIPHTVVHNRQQNRHDRRQAVSLVHLELILLAELVELAQRAHQIVSFVDHAETKRLLYASAALHARTQLAAVGQILENEEEIVVGGLVVGGVQLRRKVFDAAAEHWLVVLDRVG